MTSRSACLLLLALACTPAQARHAADPVALKGVTLGLPSPADARPTPGIGCGQLAQDLPLRAHKALVLAFSDAGATASNSDSGRWVLKVALREATMGEENTREHRTDRAPANIGTQGRPEFPPLDQQPSLFNSDNGNAVVVLEAHLAREGAVVWTGTVTGHAKSAPCIQAIDKVREALDDAIDELRDRVIPLLRR